MLYLAFEKALIHALTTCIEQHVDWNAIEKPKLFTWLHISKVRMSREQFHLYLGILTIFST